ncbi:hypothetical protein NAA97_15880 [Listeria monocytogenes]|uniref:Gp23 protein n=3 Tax=root TaxID=1 RepID=Q8W5Y4_9CAUD|nr:MULTISPECIES: hypothetical protein [Listeria]NP_511006.1 Gp23 protein [Listeria phage PSA]MCZ19044.1 hypothetical protein [Listeria monocytogenes serotype 4b]AQY44455.1 hypothetical protein DC57_09215 [Listeria monocytogenes]EAA0055540.1 hypothetical protein [Listeria monocytogenes]EAA0187969.1 hypothetical protein [Listeria monocytogenes]EAA0191048.1 hypothetical protein [Listeria monocytogenes]
MRLYSFNDFKYICYVEGKKNAVEKIFSGLLETKELKSFYKNLEKKHLDIKTIYNEYLFQCNNK